MLLTTDRFKRVRDNLLSSEGEAESASDRCCETHMVLIEKALSTFEEIMKKNCEDGTMTSLMAVTSILHLLSYCLCDVRVNLFFFSVT